MEQLQTPLGPREYRPQIALPALLRIQMPARRANKLAIVGWM